MSAVTNLCCPKRTLGPVTADPSSAPWRELEPLVLLETATARQPKQATWFKTAWNEDELRVLFFIEDDYIWATMTERNAHIYKEEVVEVFLSPEGDLGTYFEFEVNPLNTVLDLVLHRVGDGYDKDFQWQCAGFQTAVQRHPGGWSAELSIPFAPMGATPHGKPWRANFYRIDRPQGTPRELSAWSPTLQRNFHVPERFGTLEFVE